LQFGYSVVSPNNLRTSWQQPHNNEPTYQHRLDYKTILDFALCSPDLSALEVIFSVSDEIRSDHLLIQLTINTKNKNYIRAMRETKTIKTINWQKFKLLVKKQNLVGYEFGTIDELETSKFTESLQNIIAEITSTKTITIDPEHRMCVYVIIRVNLFILCFMCSILCIYLYVNDSYLILYFFITLFYIRLYTCDEQTSFSILPTIFLVFWDKRLFRDPFTFFEIAK
jgi:hypothetical protein